MEAIALELRRMKALSDFALRAGTAATESEILIDAIGTLSALLPVSGALAVVRFEGGLQGILVALPDAPPLLLEPEEPCLRQAIAGTRAAARASIVEELPLARWLDQRHPGLAPRAPECRRSIVVFGLENAIDPAGDVLLIRSETTSADRSVASAADLEFLERFRKHLEAALAIARGRFDLERSVAARTEELAQANAEINSRLVELHAAQAKLVDTSRRAGMADVATSVLHNVGNVMNSVNVSASLVMELARSSKVTALDKAVALLRAQPDPARFLAEDARGPRLLDYLASVSTALLEARAATIDELSSLSRNIDHIKAIVTQQQSLARTGGVIEELSLSQLIEDAVKMSSASSAQGHVLVECSLVAPPTIRIDRHKLFLILLNLLSNARHAVQASCTVPRIAVRTWARADDQVAIEVEDNGVGIPAALMDKIFTHGFTTRPDGHGFGLHSSACAARELGGQLSAHSAGSGQGARFTITIPQGAGSGRRDTHQPKAAAVKNMITL
jgi:signal transduction histidine kinase